ncbi:MAG: acyl-protein synthetase [Bacillales bacterium]|nr:acyl-protein synthetase [Bacillales bacterium]
MSYRRKLFTYGKMNDSAGTEQLFLLAMKENLHCHYKNSEEYRRILDARGFSIRQLETIEDLHKIPALTTLFIKSHQLFSVPSRKIITKATSSGTNGRKSVVGLDIQSGYYALRVVLTSFFHYKLFSIRPTNYIILGYEPHSSNKISTAKSARGLAMIAPARHKEYALKYTKNGYELNQEGIIEAILRYSKQRSPVRFIGFPSYMYFLLKTLQEKNIKVKLPPKSKVFFGGGWKQFFAESIEKKDLYKMVEEILGVPKEDCMDFFGAVEHPVLYCECPNHHFHIPVYSRVIIRDSKTLQPVEFGQVGLVNLISPLISSMPFSSLITDDLGVMFDGSKCGCGITTPFVELLGRVGVQNLKTCSVNAEELLGGVSH